MLLSENSKDTLTVDEVHDSLNSYLQTHTENQECAQSVDNFSAVRSHVVDHPVRIDVKEKDQHANAEMVGDNRKSHLPQGFYWGLWVIEKNNVLMDCNRLLFGLFEDPMFLQIIVECDGDYQINDNAADSIINMHVGG